MPATVSDFMRCAMITIAPIAAPTSAIPTPSLAMICIGRMKWSA